MRNKVLALLVLLVLVLANFGLGQRGFAQTSDDRGYLQALLEDSLSGEGRKVTITGFEGALSSEARVEEITVSDSEGVWLVIRKARMGWNRAALLRGAVDVGELAAEEIRLTRLPQADPAAPPSPEAAPFALPELPVSVRIGQLATQRLILGESVLGQAFEGRISGAMDLAGGAGEARLELDRTDRGPEGRFDLVASYDNATTQARISLDLHEGAGGILASLLALPGRPATELTLQGEGPISAFAADLALRTDGQMRLAGRGQIFGDAAGNRLFELELGGNPAPLFLPAYADFFGTQVALRLEGTALADGGLDLRALSVKTRQMTLTGALALDDGGAPQALHMTGRIAAEGGGAVLLPGAADRPLRLLSADLAMDFDRSKGPDWQAALTLRGLDHPQGQVSLADMGLVGRIDDQGASGKVTLTLEGLSPRDAALARASGTALWGGFDFAQDKQADLLRLSALRLTGDGFALAGDLTLQHPMDGLEVAGKLTADYQDLSRLSDLAGLPLGGKGRLDWQGKVTALSGAFDGTLRAEAVDLDPGLGQARLVRLLRGTSRLVIEARRDEAGTHIRRASLEAGQARMVASGLVQSGGVDLTGTAEVADLSALDPVWRGDLAGKFDLSGPMGALSASFAAQTRGIALGQAEADRLLAGQGRLDLRLLQKGKDWQIDRFELANPQLSLGADGTATAEGGFDLRLDGRLANLALIAPDFPGPVTLAGRIAQPATGAALQLDIGAAGPGQMQARLNGTLASDFSRADLRAKGRASAGFANPFLRPRSLAGSVTFDLGLTGTPDLSGLSGTVDLAGGRLADPGLPFSLDEIAAKARIQDARLQIGASAALSSGGRIRLEGPIGLAGAMPADLTIALDDLRLRDPRAYEARLRGALRLDGNLAAQPRLSGRIDIATAELRLDAAGFGGAAGLQGLRHLHEPGAVAATRQRAGLGDGADAPSRGAAPASGGVALDLLISAPARIFLRGRGLDAEIGGELFLRGTSAAARPDGALSLIRGRLDILGKRLTLTKADVRLEGAMLPTLDIQAETEGTSHSVAVRIEGAADDPKVSFASVPELPEEEAIALLLFDRDVGSLSALQALQLAEAVRQLAGRGGEGMLTRLRRGTGLDNLDVKTNAAGESSVTAGKYLTEKIYSEVTLDQAGKSQINLNMDLNRAVKLRARTSSDGTSGLGVVVEKDY